MSETKTEPSALQTRYFSFEVDASRQYSADEAIPVVVSSDAIVEVSDGPEILVHSREAVDLSRAPLPIIATHRGGQVNVGIVDDITISNGVMRGKAKFGTRPEAAGYREDVVNKIIRSVSVGYARMKATVRKDGVMVTTRWQPTHAALVAEPADINAGFFRSLGAVPEFKVEKEDPQESIAPENPGPTQAETEAREVRAFSFAATPAEPAIKGGTIVSEVTQASAGASAETVTAVQAERERRDAIVALCKSNKIDSRVEARWIEDGTPLTKVASELLDVMEERGRARPAAASELGLSRSETNRYSLFKAIRAMKFGSQNSRFFEEAAFELECSRAVAKSMGRELTSSILVPAEILQRPLGDAASRAMATTPGSKGGYLVNVENMGFIDILRNRSVAMSMGARQISGLTGNVVFPRQTGKGTVTWQGGEGTSVTATDQALGQLSMTPKTAIAITDVSEQLLRQSSISAEQFVMADLARDIAIDGVDYCVINGTGGSQPLGIKNTTGITSGQDASTATYAKILAFVSTAGSANAIRGNPGFVTNTAGAAKLMTVQRFTSTDTPVWEGNMLDGQLVKFKAMSSEQIASGNLIFGSWDEVVIGDWGVLELAMDNGGTRFNQAQVGIRAMWMVDVMVRYPQAFVVSTNLS